MHGKSLSKEPTVSLITVCYNSGAYLGDCLRSIQTQTYPHIEHIIIDGKSSDNTLEVIQAHEAGIAHWVSEPDEGIYDAMNKGLARATGEIVGILNADDFYPHKHVIEQVVREFERSQADTLFGDLVYVAADQLDKVTRFFPGKGFRPSHMRRGLMPPHPTFFVKRTLYQAHGNFDTSYQICADFDLMVRLFCLHEVSYSYLPKVLVHMRSGGTSTQGLKSTRIINREMLKACRKHGLSTNLLRIYSKYFTKIFQLVRLGGR